MSLSIRSVLGVRSMLAGVALVLLACGAAGAQQDTTPPVPIEFQIAPVVFDTGMGDVDLSWCLTMRDDLSGLGAVPLFRVNLESGSAFFGTTASFSGQSEATLCGTVTAPQFSAYGAYTLQIRVFDLAGNLMVITTEGASLGFNERDLCNIGPCRLTNRPSSGLPDSDGDGAPDDTDNCPTAANTDQIDTDLDLLGDACDPFPDDRDNEQAQCEADLAQCQVDVGICPADLGACETDLAQCTTDLSDSESSLATCQGDLSACTEVLPQCEVDLSTCQGSLTASEDQRIQCGADLSACTTDLSGTQTNLTACTTDLGTCQGDLQATQNALGTSNAALATCNGDLSICEANLLLQDGDGDGVPDPLDRCPSTPAAQPVDDAGCSQAQFCAQFDAATRDGAKACKKADWKNDEPLMKPAKEADCAVDKGLKGTEDDTCVPAQAE